jgi:hypothetical protein
MKLSSRKNWRGCWKLSDWCMKLSSRLKNWRRCWKLSDWCMKLSASNSSRDLKLLSSEESNSASLVPYLGYSHLGPAICSTSRLLESSVLPSILLAILFVFWLSQLHLYSYLRFTSSSHSRPPCCNHLIQRRFRIPTIMHIYMSHSSFRSQ